MWLRLFWILPEVAGERRIEGSIVLGAIAAIAVALAIALGDEWLGLLVYLSVAAALVLPMRLATTGVVAVAAGSLVIAGGLDSGAGLALQALMLGLLVALVRRLVALVGELETARGQVAELAVSEERLRLSRDMHDLLGHNLSLIALKSELARKLIGRDPEAAANEVRDVESVARESLQEARAAVRGLRSANVGAELDRAREALEAAGIEVMVRTAGPLPAGIEAVLGFAVREATTNVIRHSRARRCELEVRRAGDVAELEVRDDGVGPPGAAGEGSGLRGLGERLTEAGGALDVGPAPAGGFKLVARVPISGQARAGAEREAEDVVPTR
jgi:two-component system sensor histidine kinase DesK